MSTATTDIYLEAIIHRAMFRYRLALAAHDGAERRGEDAERYVESVLRALDRLKMLGVDVEPLIEKRLAKPDASGEPTLPGVDGR